MPLKKGKSSKTIFENANHEMKKGYSRKQAFAIAYDVAGESKPKKRKVTKHKKVKKSCK
jgi:hypothetical protein